jgi:hypothetical protein
MQFARFNVLEKIVLVGRDAQSWAAFLEGADGKRRPAEFVIPDFIADDELTQYLEDLFHESATPTNGDVQRLA